MKEKKSGFIPGGAGVGKFKVAPKDERTRTVDGEQVVFDSKLEMRMYDELERLMPGEKVSRQVVFELQPAFTAAWDGKKRRHLLYKADFVLGPVVWSEEFNSAVPGPCSMVIDAKGMILPQFRILARLFEYKFGVPVYVVKTLRELRELVKIYSNHMKIDQSLIARISPVGSCFRVKGYRDSSGDVYDADYVKLGRDGYLSLVRASHAGLLDAAGKVAAELEEEGAFDSVMVAEAVGKLKESYERTLASASQTSVESAETLTALAHDVLAVGNDPEKIAVLRLLRTAKKMLKESPAPKKTKKASVTSIKQRIEAKLPVSSYVHRLNLYAGKYEAVE